MSNCTDIFQVLATESHLQAKLAEIIPESAQFKSHYIFGVTDKVVYRFRMPDAIRCVLVSISPIIIKIGGIVPIHTTSSNHRRKSKRKKEFHLIANIYKILSKI